MSLALPRGWLILFYTKGKQSDAAEKSIPKNIDGSLTSKTIFSELKKIQLTAINLF